MKRISTLIVLNFFIIAIGFGQDIKSISPNSASQVESVVVSIMTQNTNFMSEKYSAKLVNPVFSSDVLKATSVVAVNDTLLNVVFTFNSSIKEGIYDFMVYDLQGLFSMKLKDGFTVNSSQVQPVVLSVNPENAVQGDTVDVIIKTKHTHFLQPIPTHIYLEGDSSWASPVSQTAIDNETIKAKFIIGYFIKEGIYNLSIQNSIDGYIKLNQSFTIKAGTKPPSLISVSPNSANRFGSVQMTIKGKNTSFKKDSCGIMIKNALLYLEPTATIEYLSDTVMRAHLDFADGNNYAVGLYDVSVVGRKQNYELLLPQSFTINDTILPPSLVSFDVKSGTQGDSVKMVIKGKNTHFLKGFYGVGLVNNAGILGEAKVLNDSIVEGNFFLDYLLAPGKYAVEISDLIDGLLFAVDSFTLYKGNNPPKLLSVSPNSVVQGNKVSLLIKGSKHTFSPQLFQSPQLSRNNSTVFVAKSYSIVNDSTMLANFEFPIDTNQLGTYDVKISAPIDVYNVSLPSSFTVNKSPSPPTIISISPSSATQFDTVLVKVKASHTHFLSGSVNVFMVASNNTNEYISPVSNGITILNDSSLEVKFILHANYYFSTLYDFKVGNAFDGIIELKKGFSLNRIYTQQPSIVDINPKEALRGQTVTITIKGSPQSFRTGNNVVRLGNMYNQSISIDATTVNYINDSLMTATFSFTGQDVPGNYYLHVSNLANLFYYQNSGFTLKASPSDSKLLSFTPAWASQTDSVSCVLTGFNTHFNSTDIIWLENKFGYQIKPASINVINDTAVNVKFTFAENNLPIAYSVNWKDAANNKLALTNAFTLIGSIDNSHLVDVDPKEIMCYTGKVDSIVVRAENTHFLSEADTMFIVSTRQTGIIIYPITMKVIDDTTISAKIKVDNNCWEYDVYVMGKRNYILTGKLNAFPPVNVNEEPKEAPLAVFPNPSEGMFTVNVNKDFEQASLSVFDIYGKTIISLDKIEKSTSIDLTDYAAGIYFVKLVKGDTSKAVKIIKQ